LLFDEAVYIIIGPAAPAAGLQSVVFLKSADDDSAAIHCECHWIKYTNISE
jgi:hypothetical protein